MLETTVAQLRFGSSLAFGAPFHVKSMERIVAAMRATRDEFGALGSDAGELLAGPQIDDETRRQIQLRRFRKQAQRAVRETPYHERLLASCDVDGDVDALRWEDIARLPLTPKAALRDESDAFVSRRRAAPDACSDARCGTGIAPVPPGGPRHARWARRFARASRDGNVDARRN